MGGDQADVAEHGARRASCTVTDFDHGDNRDKLRWRIQRIVTMYKSGLMELEAVVAMDGCS